MLTTLISASTIFALCVTLISLIIGYWEGKKIKDNTFQFQRRPMLAAAFCLCIYLTFTLYRHIVNGHMEILNPMSLITLYFVYEIFFFSCAAFNQTYYYTNKNYWIFFTIPPIIALVIHYVLALTVHIHEYFSFQDFINGFKESSPYCVSFRLFTIGLLGIYKIMMIYLVFDSWRKQRQQLTKDPTYRYHSTRIGRMLLHWFFMLGIIFVGQFINNAYYHVVANLLLGGLVAYSMFGFQRFYRTIQQPYHETQHSHLHQQIDDWLKTNPFPLASPGITIDQIADGLHISREDMSFYIYNICGLTFNGWLSSRRLERCVQLLEESDLNMSEIAYTTGYAHLAAMSKAFKAKYGYSPREYRKKILGAEEPISSDKFEETN